MLRHDGMVCILTHDFLQPRITLERGPFLASLEILERKLAGYGKRMGFAEDNT